MDSNKPIVDVIYGGQYGSEAKRLFIEYYVNKYKPDAIVSNFGPNSGGFLSDGSKWATFPMGFKGKILLSPGSVINMNSFFKEMEQLPKESVVFVHRNACIVTNKAIEEEKKLVTIGSTMTGTMASVSKKMGRNPNDMNIARSYEDDLHNYLINNHNWNTVLRGCKRILLVVPQGHSLSLNFGQYPYCTSRNTSPQQGLADAGIPIQWVDRIIGVFRTFPIRVANRYDENGRKIGWSGPCYFDHDEMTWEEVGQPPEMTSVSKKVRRVFSFSMHQFLESIQMNGCTDVFINFLNYLPDNQQEFFLSDLQNKIDEHELGTRLTYFGHGPTIDDIQYRRWGY